MPIPDRLRTTTADPRFRRLRTDDGSFTLESVSTGDTFHSGCGALAECDYVYLQNSGFLERCRNGQASSILEIGFGTGLAFLRSAQVAFASQIDLRYSALESLPLGREVIDSVLRWPEVEQQNASDGPVAEWLVQRDVRRFSELADELVARWDHLRPTGEVAPPANRPDALANWHVSESPAIDLQLRWQDASQWRPGIEDRYHAVYFDPFSPDLHPQLWQQEVLRTMHESLVPGGRLVSYCVNSRVRRTLAEVGFQIERVPGPPGGKREVLIATKSTTANEPGGK